VKPSHILLIDIDGLRPDVFSTAYQQGDLPQFSRLLGDQDFATGVQIPALSPAPSITFCSQACLFTGAHPSQHGIPGNQYFDRFGNKNNAVPRHYAFDVGDTLAADDAVLVFTHGLATQCLQIPTIYDRFSDWDWHSVVAGNMFAGGADTWLKPSLTSLGRFTKGGNLFGMSSDAYDRHILEKTLDYISDHGMPHILTVYFMGVDHESHLNGPGAQAAYLINHVDPFIGDLWDAIKTADKGANPLVAIFSDHGQIEVIPDDRHSLRLAFPFERELGHLFDALGLDVHDYPGEDPHCDAVVASNGGLAQVYLRNIKGDWDDEPEFKRDVYSVGRAFWEAHSSGRYASEVEGALAGVLIRNIERQGWHAAYSALLPDGGIVSLGDWFDSQPESLYADPVNRMNNLVSPYTGDLVLISNYDQGFYFSAPIKGVHGGLHPDDSLATMVFAWPDVREDIWVSTETAITQSIQNRCRAENNRQPSTTDLLTGLLAVLR
jgi:hypothetical protein